MSKYYELGGSICRPECDRACMIGVVCPCYLLARSLEDGGSMFPWKLLMFAYLIPGYYPCWLTVQLDA